MEKSKETKLYKMLQNMAEYSNGQPDEISCVDDFVSPAYAPAIDLLVEAYLSVFSFYLLMFRGLVSNASAILRILIEQTATLTVICQNTKAMYEFLRFQSLKEIYYGPDSDKRTSMIEWLHNDCNRKSKAEIKDYLDYAWIRVINNDRPERGNRPILKAAHLEELISDINEQLNAFSHGQRSIYQFIKKDDLSLAEKHIARIIMIAGKLFLLLCYAKHEFLVNEDMTSDKYFDKYLEAKILYLELNAKATNQNIKYIITRDKDLKKSILYSMSSLDHTRGLIYESELSVEQANNAARTYVLSLINVSYYLLYQIYLSKNERFAETTSLLDVIKLAGVEKIDQIYQKTGHTNDFQKLLEWINKYNDDLVFIKESVGILEQEEVFITDFTSLVHELFDVVFPGYDKSGLPRFFVPLD